MSVSRPRRVLAFAVIAITAAAATAIGSRPAPSAAPPAIAPAAAAPPGIEAALAAREARAAGRLRLAEQQLRAVAASASFSDDG
jgi:hypothetical protein